MRKAISSQPSAFSRRALIAAILAPKAPRKPRIVPAEPVDGYIHNWSQRSRIMPGVITADQIRAGMIRLKAELPIRIVRYSSDCGYPQNADR